MELNYILQSRAPRYQFDILLSIGRYMPISFLTAFFYVQLVKITVDMGGLAKEYKKGGQYIQIKVGDSKPAFYAIASAPSADKPFEIMVKNQGDTAEILCDSKSGTELLAHP